QWSGARSAAEAFPGVPAAVPGAADGAPTAGDEEPLLPVVGLDADESEWAPCDCDDCAKVNDPPNYFIIGQSARAGVGRHHCPGRGGSRRPAQGRLSVRAGTPMASAPAGTSEATTLPAATTAPRPIVTPLRMWASRPIQT